MMRIFNRTLNRVVLLSVVGVLLLATTLSCDKALDKKPYVYFGDDFVENSEEGMKGLLNGIYAKMKHYEYYGRNLYAYEAAKGPDFFVRLNSGSRFERECRYTESSIDGGYSTVTWLKIYETIRTATILLENIDHIEGDAYTLRVIKGEALALRALAYFDLMRLFAYPPLFSIEGNAKYQDKFKWGVPIIDDVETGTNPHKHIIRRESAQTTYQYIEDGLTSAMALLDGATRREGHIDYVAAAALLSRLYLYQGRWDDVIEVGEEAVLRAESKYFMITHDNYATSYYKPFNSENIWEIAYGVTDNTGGNSLNSLVRKPTYNNPGTPEDGTISATNGYAAYGLSNSAINLLNSPAADVRGYLICDLGVDGKDYYGLRKYVGEPYHFVHNIPVVRLPELYLTLAEAYAENEDWPNAELFYNKVRVPRVGTGGFSESTKAGRITNILDERRREFMLEGHNFWDYFRRGRVVNREAKENIYSTSITIVFGDKVQTVYPIPLVEMEANKDIRDQQNPGYSAFETPDDL